MSFVTRRVFPRLAAFLFIAIAGCGKDTVTPPVITGPTQLRGLGSAPVLDRYTAELWVRGNLAYTTSWSTRNGVRGNAIKIWDVTSEVPVIVDSVIVADAGTLGDVQVTDDGQYLVVAVEPGLNGAIVVYSLADPRRPTFVTRYQTTATSRGVHTATLARVGGTLYGFLCIDAGASPPGGVVLIVSLANPAVPVLVNNTIAGQPYIHDVFVRDGMLFAAAWNAGLRIYDIGGGGRGGTPANPVLVGSVLTRGGSTHNVWWYHDASGNKRYAFVGEEGPFKLFTSSSGDIHIVDLSDMTQPREVAFYNAPGAGTHNFSMDETRGVLYAAYYNDGVKALDVRGDLSVCDASQKSADGRCNLGLMRRELANTLTGLKPAYVWGVQFTGGKLYATDMLTGLWKYDAVIP